MPDLHSKVFDKLYLLNFYHQQKYSTFSHAIKFQNVIK